MMTRYFRHLSFLIIPLAVTGCIDPASLAISGASVVTAVDSGKTVTDHAMSFATGENCSFLHSFRGKAWCVPETGKDHEPPDQVCYSSIARMTCYPVENPHETASRRTY
jgi:hypothetical protein